MKKAETTETIPLEPPAHLTERSKELWQQYAGPILKSPGQFALFQSGLEALDRADAAREIISQEGMTIKDDKAKMPHQHPCLTILKEAEATVLKIWKSLFLNCPGPWGGSGNFF